MSTARSIDTHLRRANRASNPNAVRVIVMDEHNIHCLNEEMLNALWNSQPPITKAEIYELMLADQKERCRYCGCTQNHACPGGCAWLDANHTVCSAPVCAEKYKASLRASWCDTQSVSEALEELYANV